MMEGCILMSAIYDFNVMNIKKYNIKFVIISTLSDLYIVQ